MAASLPPVLSRAVTEIRPEASKGIGHLDRRSLGQVGGQVRDAAFTQERTGRRVGGVALDDLDADALLFILAGTERLAHFDRQPTLWVRSQLIGVAFKFSQVVERIGPTELAGVDEAHKYVANTGTVFGLVEHGVLAMKDGLLSARSQILLSSGAPGLRRKSVSFSQCLSMYAIARQARSWARQDARRIAGRARREDSPWSNRCGV